MKTKIQKKQSFIKEMEKLKKEGKLKEEKEPFISTLKKAVKPRSSSR